MTPLIKKHECRQRRDVLGITRLRLAIKAGVSIATLNNFESPNGRLVAPQTIRKITDALTSFSNDEHDRQETNRLIIQKKFSIKSAPDK